ncbi:MAG: VCBS repeat-containing protein, partial [Planctomycetota bacterium]
MPVFSMRPVVVSPSTCFRWIAGSLLLLGAASCRLTLTDLVVPSTAPIGGVFEVSVLGDVPLSGQRGDSAGCVLQVPNGFTVVSWTFEENNSDYNRAPHRDDPALLAAYTAEPGHYLISFHDTQLAFDWSEAPGVCRLRVVFSAGSVPPGNYTFKVALAQRPAGATAVWTAEQPPVVTQFHSILTAPHAKTVQITAMPPTLFQWVQVPFGLPVGESLGAYLGFVDLDGDGIEEAVGQRWTGTTSQTFEFVCRRWTGTQGWLPYAAPIPLPLFPGNPPDVLRPLAFGDFDGDGRNDLVFRDGRTFFGVPLGFVPGPVLQGASSYVVAGDTNGDGCDDILLHENSGPLHHYRGSPNRTFVERFDGLPTVHDDKGSALLADLNGDGALDLYLPRTGNPNVWLGNGLGAWTPAIGIPAEQREGFLADVTGDGVAELVLGGASLGNLTSPAGIHVYRSTGPTSWTRMVGNGLPTTGAYPRIAALDVDGDGALDLVAGDTVLRDRGPKLFRNDGNGSFAERTGAGFIAFGQVHQLVAGDINGDGSDDLLVQTGLIGAQHYTASRGASLYAPFGAGCAGSAGVATNRMASLPWVGEISTITLSPAPIIAAGFLLIGSSNTHEPGIGALPLHLAACGAPGCYLRVTNDVASYFATGAGRLDYRISVPLLPALIGQSFFTQGVILDSANAFGLVMTQASTMRIGGA